MINITDYNYFYFDLDRNIWDTTDKYGNAIWARQLIFPLTQISENSFCDDCLSHIKLQDGIKDFLEYLQVNNKRIGFISRGANLNIPLQMQPSYNVLHLFDLYKFFDDEMILLHKNKLKHQNITRNKFIFFDDSEEEIILMQSNKEESKCILRSKFNNWRDLI